MMKAMEEHKMASPQQQQFLVRFCDRTHAITASDSSNLLETLSLQTGWPVSSLRLNRVDYPFASVSVISGIRGGKGGFGTLLKGQSKKAGAKLTVDFGACRDLQGRRLRHVNDEIKLRKWRDIQRRKANGEQVDEVEESKTATGILNWHLNLPSWVAESMPRKQLRRKEREFQRELRQIIQAEEDAKLAKAKKKQERQQMVSEYVRQGTEASDLNRDSISDAIQQGLRQQKLQTTEKRSRVEEEEQHPQTLVTLSGDAVVLQYGAVFQIQSKSDFCTVALVLEGELGDNKALWYEIKLVTAGLAQVGWADLQGFEPNTESGDGVGDDSFSFSFDGSRRLKFHNGKEQAYGKEWSAGDVIGCRYDAGCGEISYSLNGQDLGIAFETGDKGPLVPAMSCNQGEILELVISQGDLQYKPSKSSSVETLMHESLVDAPIGECDESEITPEESNAPEPKRRKKEDSLKDAKETKTQSEELTLKKQKKSEASSPPKPLNLDEFDSTDQLKEVGLDRLKEALLALGVKCGGSLEERADRLFSLKGLKREDYPMKVRGKSFVV